MYNKCLKDPVGLPMITRFYDWKTETWTTLEEMANDQTMTLDDETNTRCLDTHKQLSLF